MIKAYKNKRKVEQEEKLVIAYLGAYWQRVKRMPSIKQILGKEQPKREMTAKEMLEQVRKLNAALGGTEVK